MLSGREMALFCCVDFLREVGRVLSAFLYPRSRRGVCSAIYEGVGYESGRGLIRCRRFVEIRSSSNWGRG